ncbi:transcriptional regulator GlxA family with amidase domain [Paraburkholderia sp. EB58]|jgi:transcriptional regulator GlxA family with amidase domain|uniref:GlxA family transcriptional regulator n=1 Tax=Paraburkholderia sp. EB58 TaxID=3035125 RepID=UPI003D260448
MMRGFGEQESDRNQRGRDETQVLPADRLEHCTAKHAGAGESDVCRGIVERNLQRSFPTIAVEEDQIFIVGGPIWTSAGMTATIDMALAMIEKDHGQDVSRAVARKLVVHHRRAGGQSQFSTLLDLEPKSDRIQKAIDYANANLRNALTVEELADVAGLSPRQFSRAFSAETAQSPAKAVEHLRVEAARLLLEKGRLSLDVIADEVGFSDRERMRRAFLRTIGQPPQAVRRFGRETRGPIGHGQE